MSHEHRELGLCNTFSLFFTPFFFSHDVAKQPEDNKNSPLCNKSLQSLKVFLTKIPVIQDLTGYRLFHAPEIVEPFDVIFFGT